MAQAVEEEIVKIVVRRERSLSGGGTDRESQLTAGSHIDCPSKKTWSQAESTVKFSMLDIPWFHPNLTRHHAEAELRNSEEGVYLLRPRLDADTEGYSLDIRSAHSVKHFRINVQRGRLVFGQETFSKLETFLEHFKNLPLIGDETGHLIVFKHPYPRDIDEIHEYSHVLEHFIPQAKISPGIEQASVTKTYSLVSKEGYLVKLGNFVKTWKKRWFVLNNEQLCYYAKQRNKTPIRAIDIREVTDVAACELHPIHRKQNVFRVVLPRRTFFLVAPSPAIRDEWIHVLEFKLREVTEAKRRTVDRSATNRIISHN